jgi:uncharacterized protein (TIGR00251 family)
MLSLEQAKQGFVLPVRAHPGSRRNAILGEREGALRVAVTAAPEKGKANQAIIALLSKTLGVSKSAIELASGDTSQHKRFIIQGTSLEAAREKLAAIIGDET